MELETRSWTTGTGWSQPLPKHPDCEATLVIAFGYPGLIDHPTPIDDVREAFGRSHVVGCSTAGQILSDGLSDRALVMSVARFAATRVSSSHARVLNPGEFRSPRRVRALRRTAGERERARPRALERASSRRPRGWSDRRRRAVRPHVGARRRSAAVGGRRRYRPRGRCGPRRLGFVRRLGHLRSGADHHPLRGQRALRARRPAGARAVQEVPRRSRKRAPGDGDALPPRHPPDTRHASADRTDDPRGR